MAAGAGVYATAKKVSCEREDTRTLDLDTALPCKTVSVVVVGSPAENSDEKAHVFRRYVAMLLDAYLDAFALQTLKALLEKILPDWMFIETKSHFSNALKSFILWLAEKFGQEASDYMQREIKCNQGFNTGLNCLTDMFSHNVLPAIIDYLVLKPLFWSQYPGQTPGKKIMGLKVVKEDGSEATIEDYYKRNAIRCVIPLTLRALSAKDIIPIHTDFALEALCATTNSVNCWWAVFDANTRAGHDCLAGTKVVNTHDGVIH
jgi:hypothetical protein